MTTNTPNCEYCDDRPKMVGSIACATCSAEYHPDEVGTYEVFHATTYGHDLELDEYGEQRYPDGWYWWACAPGCLPDGEPQGPFETEADASADAKGN